MSVAISQMMAKKPGCEIVESAIRVVEDDPEVFTVGRGGLPNMLGQVECDAAIMHGTTLETGAIGGLKGFRHPISVARALMRQLPHEFLIGDGARRFAKEIGAEKSRMHTRASKTIYQQWLAQIKPKMTQRQLRSVGQLSKVIQYLTTDTTISLIKSVLRQRKSSVDVGGTTIYLLQDHQRHIVAGVSTSGWPFKYPGRLGDSPVIGAGIYAESTFGACGCVGLGELSIRSSMAASVVRYLEKGATVQSACYEGLEILRRMYLSQDIRHIGAGVQVHVIGKNDQYFVMYATPQHNDGQQPSYCIWTTSEPHLQVKNSVQEII